MKRTITINIAGKNFAMEDEASQKLEVYLEDYERNLGEDVDKRDVMSDIETSLADHFSQFGTDKVLSGKEIDLVLSKMGRIEKKEMSSESNSSNPNVVEKNINLGVSKSTLDVIIDFIKKYYIFLIIAAVIMIGLFILSSWLMFKWFNDSTDRAFTWFEETTEDMNDNFNESTDKMEEDYNETVEDMNEEYEKSVDEMEENFWNDVEDMQNQSTPTDFDLDNEFEEQYEEDKKDYDDFEKEVLGE